MLLRTLTRVYIFDNLQLVSYSTSLLLSEIFMPMTWSAKQNKNIQVRMDNRSRFCKAFGQVVLFQPVPVSPYTNHRYLDGHEMKVVDK